MAEQNRSSWDRSLIQKGFSYLEKSSFDKNISIYHILAAISAQHCAAPDFESTDWKTILSLYDSLIEIDHSPVVLLNRAIALSKVAGAEQALTELDKIKDNPAMASYHLFYSTKAEFYIQTGDFQEAADCLKRAIGLSPLEAEKDLLKEKLSACTKKII
jgi:RNA polymerase sigma-70 factor (ECF subfamily)